MFICEFESIDGLETGCSACQLDFGGFNEALILDEMGNIVASGEFTRRGGGRTQPAS